VVTHQLKVERRTAKAHRPKTNALPRDHATNSGPRSCINRILLTKTVHISSFRNTQSITDSSHSVTAASGRNRQLSTQTLSNAAYLIKPTHDSTTNPAYNSTHIYTFLTWQSHHCLSALIFCPHRFKHDHQRLLAADGGVSRSVSCWLCSWSMSRS